MNKQFDRDTFVKAFDKALGKLKRAETMTKDVLRTLSRDVLEAWHATGDVAFANKTLAVLTPVNRKVAVKFFTEFSGFSYDDVAGIFTKKSKKRYDAAFAAAVEFLADPHQNIWTWADRNIEIQQKEFTVDKVEDVIKRAIKKNISQLDILKAVLHAGVELDSIIALMGEAVPADKQEAVLDSVGKVFGYEAKMA